jgi:hypothetical protein
MNTHQAKAIGERISWKQLIALEPRLLELYREAKATRDDKGKSSFCANHAWYGRRGHEGFKHRMCELIGYSRKDDPVLGSKFAYDVAYHTIYNALPDCRNCICFDARGFLEATGRLESKRRTGTR